MPQLQTLDSQTPDSSHPRETEAVRVRLRDGGAVALRPLGPGETEPLLAVFAAMSDGARAKRYLTGMTRLPGGMVRMLAAVDGDRHVAWLASIDGEPAGIARYVRLQDRPTTAELAFEVADRHHGRGLATVLLDAVTTVGSARSVRRVLGTTDPGNTASRRLLAKVGADDARVVDGLLEAEGTLRLLEDPVVDRGAVLRLACEGSSASDEVGTMDRAV